jgi:hypothetical protein
VGFASCGLLFMGFGCRWARRRLGVEIVRFLRFWVEFVVGRVRFEFW